MSRCVCAAFGVFFACRLVSLLQQRAAYEFNVKNTKKNDISEQ